MTKLMLPLFKTKKMNLKPIKTEADYKIALRQLDELFDAKIGSKESDLADILALMVDEYERKHYAISTPDPIEAIKIRMEELDLRQIDLINVIGGKSRVSEVLNKKRKLTVEMIRNLTKKLNLSASLLIKDYQLL